MCVEDSSDACFCCWKRLFVGWNIVLGLVKGIDTLFNGGESIVSYTDLISPSCCCFSNNEDESSSLLSVLIEFLTIYLFDELFGVKRVESR